MTRIECPTATAAFLLPMRLASRQYWADREVSRLRAAAQAHPGEHLPSQRLPLVGLPERRLPPVRLLPGKRVRPGGQVPGGGEHAHVGADLGDDRLRSPLADPGNGVQPVTGPSERGDHLVDAAVEVAIAASRCSRWSSASPTSNPWCSPKRPRSA